jgi:hypothetical protein
VFVFFYHVLSEAAGCWLCAVPGAWWVLLGVSGVWKRAKKTENHMVLHLLDEDSKECLFVLDHSFSVLNVEHIPHNTYILLEKLDI